jgi:hypothetical protein
MLFSLVMGIDTDAEVDERCLPKSIYELTVLRSQHAGGKNPRGKRPDQRSQIESLGLNLASHDVLRRARRNVSASQYLYAMPARKSLIGARVPASVEFVGTLTKPEV